MYQIIGLLSMIVLLSACGGEPGYDLRSYYFPLDSLADGQVYEYRAVKEAKDPPFYWYYRSVEQDDQLFLAAMFYDQNFEPYQVVREEVTETGILARGYYLLESDTGDVQTQVPATITENSVYPFYPSDVGGVYVFSINWSMPSDSGAVTTLVRNRQFMGDTTVNYQGKEYEAVNFYVRELVDIENEGHAEYEYDGWEIYAQGIGLVYTRKNVADDFVIEYQLHDRYPMTELEAKFSATLPPPEE